MRGTGVGNWDTGKDNDPDPRLLTPSPEPGISLSGIRFKEAATFYSAIW